MSLRPQSFNMPLVLRRCLLDNLSGAVAVTAAGENSPLATMHVQGGQVTFVTSADRAARPGERHEAFITDRVCALAEVRDASATFDAGGDPPVNLPPVSIPSLLLAVMRSVSDLARIEQWLGDQTEELMLVGDPFVVFAGAPLKPDDGFFLSRLDRPMTAAQILAEAALDRSDGLRLVCALRYSGGLQPTQARGAWVGDGDPFSGVATAATPDSVDLADVARVCYRVEEKLRDVEGGADYYVLLEVERRAPAERIKASYRELAKTFHPDRHAQLALFDADVKARLEVVFTALTTAYSTLGNGKDREAYDLKLAKRDQRTARPTPPPANSAPQQPSASAPRPAPPPPPSPPRPPAPPPSARPTPPPTASAPPPSTPTKTVKPAVPKSIVPPLSPAAPAPPPRMAIPPEELVRPVAAPKPPPMNPEKLFEHGIAYADSGDFERAAFAFKRGVDMAPQDARMHAALGSALANLHGLDKAAESALRRAVELDPASPDLFIELALVYQRFDRLGEAQTLFKRAYLLDPTNEAAIAALNDRTPGRGDAAGLGFLKRLFNRK